ncbi:succinate dehydrogenase/fumarate reductase transmembrane subunit [Desulfocurvus sp. DL9XJH121]
MTLADSTLHVTRPSRASAYLDWLQMLSGAALILFIICHMLLVSSVLLGSWALDGLAGFLEATYLAQVGGPALALLFLFHFVLAARKVPFRTLEQKTIWAHARTLRHRDTWLWVVQAATGMIVLLLGAIHMWSVLTDLPISAAKSAAFLASASGVLFNLALLVCVALHTWIGCYRIGVKWGFVLRAGRAKAMRAVQILLAVYVGMGLLTTIRFLFMAP